LTFFRYVLRKLPFRHCDPSRFQFSSQPGIGLASASFDPLLVSYSPFFSVGSSRPYLEKGGWGAVEVTRYMLCFSSCFSYKPSHAHVNRYVSANLSASLALPPHNSHYEFFHPSSPGRATGLSNLSRSGNLFEQSEIFFRSSSVSLVWPSSDQT